MGAAVPQSAYAEAPAMPGKGTSAPSAPTAGSAPNLTAELFKATAGLDVVVVPSRTSGEAVVALLRNDVQMVIDFYAALKPPLSDGKARALTAKLEAGLEEVRARSVALPRRPRVYFEEWDDPLISGIRWVSELIELAGGEDCFPELARQPLGRDRIIADPVEVTRRAPDIVLGSWCGKKFRPDALAARPGWSALPAVRDGYVREIKSSLILQPGPAALTDGVRAIQSVITEWAERR